MNKPSYLKILVANRQSLFCKGFKANFNRRKGIAIDKAQCSTELFNRLSQDKYNMLYVQDKLPDLNLQAAVPLIIAQHPQIKIVVHTESDDPDYIRALNSLGIHGIMSQFANESLVPVSIETIYGGKKYVCPDMHDILFTSGTPIVFTPSKILEANLSQRQQQTLTGQLQGKTRAQIAHKMGIKVDTLRNHIKAMRGKLDNVGLLNLLPDFDRQAQKKKK